MSPHSLALPAATEDDLPFLLSLRKVTMTTKRAVRMHAPCKEGRLGGLLYLNERY